VTVFGISLKLKAQQLLYFLIHLNENLSKRNQNLVHYPSCQGVRHTAYLNFCSPYMVRHLDHEGPVLGLEDRDLGLSLQILTL